MQGGIPKPLARVSLERLTEKQVDEIELEKARLEKARCMYSVSPDGMRAEIQACERYDRLLTEYKTKYQTKG